GHGRVGRCGPAGGARSGSARTPVHQSSLRPAHAGPRGRADGAPRAGRRAARAFPGLERRGAHRGARARHGAWPARAAHAQRVERRDRVPVAADQSGPGERPRAGDTRQGRGAVLAMLPGTTGVAPERIRVRMRRRTRRGEQYDKVDEQARFHVVTEGGLRFRVNFEDYLDTGLFLDQRTTRARLRDAARGKRFLNLFAYTGAATVYAAAGGAASTTSVDLSRTYI